MSRSVIGLLLAATLLVHCGKKQEPIVVGSKNFTESVILGELLAQSLEASGCVVNRRLNMGGSFVADTAILSGELDTYVEYSGTALTAILKQPAMNDRDKVNAYVRDAYGRRGLSWGPNLGFNNTFAMIVRRADSQRYSLSRISDLQKVSDRYRPAFGPEFVSRPDGYEGLLKTYGLTFKPEPRTMDLGLTYRALAAGQVDLIAGNSTDGLIESLGLVALADDRGYFPPYDAAVVRRNDIDAKCPKASQALTKLERRIDEPTMRQLNFEVDGKKRDVKEVVREFLGKG